MDQFPTLHTGRLDLIEIQQNHLGDLYRLFSNEEVTRYYNLLPFKNQQEALKLMDWFCCRCKEGLGIRWGIALKGEQSIIGTIGFNNYARNHRANIGYDLQPAFWNQAYMTEALRAVMVYGFEELEINRIEAEVMLGNDASNRLLEKLGFCKEGVLRQWMYWNENYYDMSMYCLLKCDYK